nr:centrosomal protein of 83 kDa-like [Nicotiana tomentosiformis]
MDEVKAMAGGVERQDRPIASEKETIREQLSSTEAQLRLMKEKAEARSRKIEELQSQLNSVVPDRETIAKELKAAKSVADLAKADADETVDQYKADAEATQECLKAIVDHVKWQSQREALNEVHAQGFDLLAQLENVKRLEAEAKNLAYPKNAKYFKGSDGSENWEDSDGPVMRRAPVRIRPLRCLVIFAYVPLYFIGVLLPL